MESNRASRTAEYMAFYRAMESARPRAKRLFTDAFAIHFLRPSLRKAVVVCRIPYLAAVVAWYADRKAPGARTSAIARTRLIDDIVSQSLHDGIHQVVIVVMWQDAPQAAAWYSRTCLVVLWAAPANSRTRPRS